MTEEEHIYVPFQFEKETKNMIRFTELAEEPIVGYMYLSKVVWGDMGKPEFMYITIHRAADREEGRGDA